MTRNSCELPRYYDRAAGRLCVETVLGDRWLRLAYCSPLRGALRWPLFSCALFSRLMGWYLDRPASVRRIEPTIRELSINMDEAVVPPGGYRSFNDFFARRLKPGARPLPSAPDALLSPADCRLAVYPRLDQDTVVPVKGTPYRLQELMGDAALAATFRNGALLVGRLCPADYHRYHCPDSGTVVDIFRLRGKYHSVNPLALERGYRVFTENLRLVIHMRLRRGIQCAMIPVGAFGVASIHNDLAPAGKCFQRGDEAGYFTFGGSTVIMVYPEDSVRFDDDILRCSGQGIETLVRANSRIGCFTGE